MGFGDPDGTVERVLERIDDLQFLDAVLPGGEAVGTKVPIASPFARCICGPIGGADRHDGRTGTRRGRHYGRDGSRAGLNAHAYLRVEQPPELWEADVDDVALVRMLGEMIAAALARGTVLDDVVVRVNNVTVDPPGGPDRDDEEDGCEPPAVPAPGDYVALTVLGEGDWRPEVLWGPGATNDGSPLVNADLDAAARAAGVPFAYTRSSGAGGSVTVFLPRTS